MVGQRGGGKSRECDLSLPSYISVPALSQHCSHPLNTRDERARPTAWGAPEGLG